MKRFLLWLWREMPVPFALRYIFLWLFNPKFLVGVDALIVKDDNEVLLFKHSYRKGIPWGLPSGWLKKGEDPIRAIQREIFEESGFRVRILRPLLVEKSKKFSRIDVVYLGELKGEDAFVPSEEVCDARFFPIEGLPMIIINQERIIKDYFNTLLGQEAKMEKGAEEHSAFFNFDY